jgi:hypothetical protein
VIVSTEPALPVFGLTAEILWADTATGERQAEMRSENTHRFTWAPREKDRQIMAVDENRVKGLVSIEAAID